MNISNLKSRFPVFKKNPNLVFLDTAASALKVDEMIEATNNCYTNEYANIHRGSYELSSKLTKKFEDARKKIADYLNTSEKNIIFVKSATEGINLIASCMSKEFLEDGDEIILSYLEHHANLIPWHLIAKKIRYRYYWMVVNLHLIKKLILKNWIQIFTFFLRIKCMALQVLVYCI